jgi:hypothetical protein
MVMSCAREATGVGVALVGGMPISRRSFAKGLGLAALLTPLVSTFRRTTAFAAGGGKAKYLLLFHTNGTDPGLWTPTGSSPSSIAFSQMTEPLAPLAPNLVLVEQLSSNGSADNHGEAGGLTGQGYSGQNQISIDQYIADKLKAAGVTTPISSLILGSVATEQQSTFWRNNMALTPIFSPVAAFQAIFSNVAGGGAMGDSPDVVRRRKQALALVSAELQTLSGRVGANERTKLDLHGASVQAVLDRLNNPGGTSGGACSVPAAPATPSQDLLASSECLDLAVAAFACDLTRVAAVQFGHHQNTQVSLTDVGNPGNWHNDFIHGDNPRTRLINLERWLCGQFVAAANKLKSIPAAGGGTLFDQTLMVWTRDMGDAINHNGSNMRFVFSGGAGGFLTTSPNGRYIDGGGDSHQRALITCAAAMGVDDYSGFGDPAQPRTPLTSIGQ